MSSWMKGRRLSLALLSFLCLPPLSYGETPIEDVKTALTHRDWQVHLSALDGLANRKDKEAIDLLIGVAENRGEYWKVQIKAIQLLGKTGDARATDLLVYILNSNTGDWRCPAIHSSTATALGNFRNDSRAFEALVRGLQNEELITREASIRALGNIGNADALPHLLPLLKDVHLAVRLSTVEALALIRDQGAIPFLREAAENDSDDTLRGEARRALTYIIRAR